MFLSSCLFQRAKWYERTRAHATSQQDWHIDIEVRRENYSPLVKKFGGNPVHRLPEPFDWWIRRDCQPLGLFCFRMTATKILKFITIILYFIDIFPILKLHFFIRAMKNRWKCVLVCKVNWAGRCNTPRKILRLKCLKLLFLFKLNNTVSVWLSIVRLALL